MRTRLLLPALLSGVLALGACGGAAEDDEQDDGPGPAADSTATTAAADAVLLEAPADAGAGRCMAPSADVLGEADIAFDGTVRSVEHGLVDLEVARWYRGGGGDLARVRAQPGAMQALIGAVAFEEGGRFLVAGQDSDLMVCGLSAPYDDALAGLYAEAFGD